LVREGIELVKIVETVAGTFANFEGCAGSTVITDPARQPHPSNSPSRQGNG
jgi:hypothetical protein